MRNGRRQYSLASWSPNSPASSVPLLLRETPQLRLISRERQLLEYIPHHSFSWPPSAERRNPTTFVGWRSDKAYFCVFFRRGKQPGEEGAPVQGGLGGILQIVGGLRLWRRVLFINLKTGKARHVLATREGDGWLKTRWSGMERFET